MGFKEFTDRVMSGEYDGSRRHLQKLILEEDWIHTIEKVKNQTSTRFVANISSKISWLRLWDSMLEQGHEGTVALQAFLK